MERRSRAILQRADDGGAWLMVKLDHMPNLDHIETVSGSKEQFYVDWELVDKRRVRKKQRRLFFALLNDIMYHFVVPQDFLKDMFYLQYQYYTGKEISLADYTRSSVTDANVLIELVVDFMFEWHVPFAKGYELLPKDEQYFIYQCCRHRVCLMRLAWVLIVTKWITHNIGCCHYVGRIIRTIISLGQKIFQIYITFQQVGSS